MEKKVRAKATELRSFHLMGRTYYRVSSVKEFDLFLSSTPSVGEKIMIAPDTIYSVTKVTRVLYSHPSGVLKEKTEAFVEIEMEVKHG